ncbi:hypothetical protein BJ741DRAFT_651474 [Chytriomyces cf. hyalinus JEL632]|nr:hypothetical protein BJ741DRAFT_651474 [Chytriomyces cf. hyalinus JEL632]
MSNKSNWVKWASAGLLLHRAGWAVYDLASLRVSVWSPTCPRHSLRETTCLWSILQITGGTTCSDSKCRLLFSPRNSGCAQHIFKRFRKNSAKAPASPTPSDLKTWLFSF